MTATKMITVLALASANFSMIVDGKTQSAVMKEIKDAGHNLGTKALAQLMTGKATEANGWTLTKTEAPVDATSEVAKTETTTATPDAATAEAVVNATGTTNDDVVLDQVGNSEGATVEAETNSSPEAPTTAAPAPAASAPVAASKVKVPGLLQRIMAAKAHPSLNDAEKYANLTPEQKALAEQAEKDNPTQAKFTYKGTDWNAPGVLPDNPVAVLRDSKMHKFFEFITDPDGKTREEICAEFNWTPGGFGGIIHWEPKAKGYLLITEKKDGKIRYSLGYKNRNGERVKPGTVVVRDKAAPVPKAPKAPKAVAAPAAPKVRVPKEGMQQAAGAMPPAGGGTIVSKRSNKKAAA